MKKLFFLHLFLSVSLILPAHFTRAQEKIIHGKVTTFDSIPLAGVSIKVKSTGKIFKSDSLGLFTMPAQASEKLFFLAKGFYSQRVKIDDPVKYVLVNMKLKPGIENREYAIGYGYVTDKDKLYAVSSLNEKDLDFSQYSSIYDLIIGRFPGVEVRNGEVIIRGTKSFMASNAALIVVDGVVVDNSYLGMIIPTNVSSINILKDSSSAIYGARGANGVVIIETKRGLQNK